MKQKIDGLEKLLSKEDKQSLDSIPTDKVMENIKTK